MIPRICMLIISSQHKSMLNTMPSSFPENEKQLYWPVTVRNSSCRACWYSIFMSQKKSFVKSLLKLHQHAHHNGYPVKDMPPIALPEAHQEILSAREIEVLVLITKGLINKEIADKLNISLTTVITHRKTSRKNWESSRYQD